MTKVSLLYFYSPSKTQTTLTQHFQVRRSERRIKSITKVSHVFTLHFYLHDIYKIIT